MKSRNEDEYVAAVTAFGAHHPGLTLGGTERRHCQEWVQALATARPGEDPPAEGTIIRKLCAVRNYWGWLQAQSKVAEDHLPFARPRIPGTVKRTRGPDDEPRPFACADVVRLWRAARDKREHALADLIRLGAHTGARIESLCLLTSQLVRVDRDRGIRFLKFYDKTDAGVREVPVHPAIAGLVDRLLRDSRDGFLIPVASVNKHGERSPLLGKRFTRLKRRLGFGDQHTFNSIRKTVATLFQNAGCPEATAADVIGHEKPGLTYGLYSGGASLPVKLAWLERAIDYGDAAFMAG